MIIWGGTDCGVLLNSGAIYDPVADSWSPTSLAGVPSPRRYHLAVWTGDQMIVWGGRDGSTLLNTGGRYNPAAGTWTATSTLNTPRLYQLATGAVWTGRLMLVWATPYGGGSRYDPVQDVWTAYSTPPSQARTQGATAVWTGSRMIIWGGGAAPSGDFAWAINTGAIYDPIGDSWVLTSMENAASERFDHTAVWTGTYMIVWGGWGPADVTPILNNGGRFIYGQSLDDDGDGFTECVGDCNDADPSVCPGAPQICDGLNNDCNAPGWPSLGGTNEADNDGDAFSVCQGDCNDASPLVWLSPVEIANLGLSGSGPTNIAWDSQGSLVGPETSYDLTSGSMSDGLNFASGTCLQTAGGATYTDTRANPGPGAGYWYLSRGRNSCAVGTYGSSQRDSSIPSCP
jgi:hypothetical protein